MNKKLLNNRCWLRPMNGWGDESSVLTTCEVTDNSRWKDDTLVSVITANFRLRDCSNTIELYFEADTPKLWLKQRNAMVKLRSKLDAFIDSWDEAYDLIETEDSWKKDE